MVRSEIQNVKLRFGIIGNSEGLNRAIDIAIQVAPTDLSVLITGESGVGKENFPQIIHQFSRRKHGQYIAVNCGAIPEGTIDSELFGHEKGAFTGAISDRKGINCIPVLTNILSDIATNSCIAVISFVSLVTSEPVVNLSVC